MASRVFFPADAKRSWPEARQPSICWPRSRRRGGYTDAGSFPFAAFSREDNCLLYTYLALYVSKYSIQRVCVGLIRKARELKVLKKCYNIKGFYKKWF